MSKSAWRSHGIVSLTLNRPTALPSQMVGKEQPVPAPIRAVWNYWRGFLSSLRALILRARV